MQQKPGIVLILAAQKFILVNAPPVEAMVARIAVVVLMRAGSGSWCEARQQRHMLMRWDEVQMKLFRASLT